MPYCLDCAHKHCEHTQEDAHIDREREGGRVKEALKQFGRLFYFVTFDVNLRSALIEFVFIHFFSPSNFLPSIDMYSLFPSFFIFHIRFLFVLQSYNRTKRGTNQTSDECFHGVFTSGSQNDCQEKSQLEKFGPEQIFGLHMEVSKYILCWL